MTTEAGGGDELRERLALLFTKPEMSLAAMTLGEAFGDQEPERVRVYGGRADAILAEIAAAGYEIRPADQLERVLAWAELAWVEQHFFPASMLPSARLQPGDLDAPGWRA